MEITYDRNTDMMYIRFSHKKVVSNTVAADNSVVLDLAEDETIIGMELISPSRYVENIEEIIYRLAKPETEPPSSSHMDRHK